MSEILIRNADVIVTMDATRRELNGADLLLRGGVIAAVGHELRTAGRVVNAMGCVVTPGLVNVGERHVRTVRPPKPCSSTSRCA